MRVRSLMFLSPLSRTVVDMCVVVVIVVVFVFLIVFVGVVVVVVGLFTLHIPHVWPS